MVKSVLFVCTGNTCRSVMAEHLLRHYAGKAGLELKIVSAGLAAAAGGEATANTLEVLFELGIDASGHRTRTVDFDSVQEFDLILTMTEAHKARLLTAQPELAERVFLLKEFAQRNIVSGQELREEEEKEYDISDPYGQSLRIYRQSRGEISSAVQKIVESWLKRGK